MRHARGQGSDTDQPIGEHELVPNLLTLLCCAKPLLRDAHFTVGERQQALLLLLLPEALAFLEELHEDRDLRPQNVRGHRRQQKINSAELISAPDVVDRAGARGDEHDWEVACSRVPLNRGGGFESAHPGQDDVEQDHGKLTRLEPLERLLPGPRRLDVLVQRAECGSKGLQVGFLVVHDQDPGQRFARAGRVEVPDQRPNLGAQQVELHGFFEEVHGARDITARGQLGGLLTGEEHDGRGAVPCAPANRLGCLETIHPRHHDIEQDQ